MPRDKSKRGRVFGRPTRMKTDKDQDKPKGVPDMPGPPIPPPPEKPPSPPEVDKGEKLCKTCTCVDISTTGVGLCKKPKVLQVCEGWDGIVQNVNQFGCLYHSS